MKIELFLKCFIFLMYGQKVLAWGNACRKRQGHPGVGQGNILSVTLSLPSSSFYSQGLLWIFGYSAFSPWPSTNKYKPQNLCRGSLSLAASFMTLWTTSFFWDPCYTVLAKQRHQHVLPSQNNLWGGESRRRHGTKTIYLYEVSLFEFLILNKNVLA